MMTQCHRTNDSHQHFVCVLSAEKVLDSCSFRDEDDDCTYSYTVANPKDPTVKDLEVQVLKKKGELPVIVHVVHTCS